MCDEFCWNGKESGYWLLFDPWFNLVPMYDLIKYGNEAFILFTFPLVGLVFERTLSKRQTLVIMGIAAVLFLPIITPYRYIIPYAFRTLLLIMLSAAFGCYLKTLEKNGTKVWISFITSAILFFPFAFFGYMDSFAGYQKVQRTWHVDDYRVEYIADQGFAGRARMTYELSKYCMIPLLIRNVETIVDNDTTGSCLLEFAESRIVFDKCNGTVIKKMHKP